MDLTHDGVRVSLVYIGEGHFGAYPPDNPKDEQLLRFYVGRQMFDGAGAELYAQVEDASCCARVPCEAPIEVQARALGTIMAAVHLPVVRGEPIKEICERLSWIDSQGRLE